VDLDALLDGLSAEAREQITSKMEAAEQAREQVALLERKKEKLLSEKKGLQRIEKLLASCGIDPKADDFEDQALARLVAQQQQGGGSKGDGKPKDPGAKDAGSKDGGESLNPEVRAQLAEMSRQMQQMADELKLSKQREQEAIERQRTDRVERTAIEALTGAGVERAGHLLRLIQLDPKYRLSLGSDGASVIGGSDTDSYFTLSEVVDRLKKDDDYSYFFPGRGSSSSGMGMGAGSGGQRTGTGGSNPFRTDSQNATEASRLLMEKPDQARKLMTEANAVGKLAPVFKRRLKAS